MKQQLPCIEIAACKKQRNIPRTLRCFNSNNRSYISQSVLFSAVYSLLIEPDCTGHVLHRHTDRIKDGHILRPAAAGKPAKHDIAHRSKQVLFIIL